MPVRPVCLYMPSNPVACWHCLPFPYYMKVYPFRWTLTLLLLLLLNFWILFVSSVLLRPKKLNRNANNIDTFSFQKLIYPVHAQLRQTWKSLANQPLHSHSFNTKQTNLLHKTLHRMCHIVPRRIPLNFDIFLSPLSMFVSTSSSSVSVVVDVPCWFRNTHTHRWTHRIFFSRLFVRFHYGFRNWISVDDDDAVKRKKNCNFFVFIFKLFAWFNVDRERGKGENCQIHNMACAFANKCDQKWKKKNRRQQQLNIETHK